MLRAVAPRAWAIAIHTVASPRPSALNARATGPGPLRTARGAGRVRDAVFRVVLRVDFLGALEPLRVLRDRVLEPLRPLRLDLDEDVLLLRDPGGEDVRVAMVNNLGHSHTSHRDHRIACRPPATTAREIGGPG